MKIIEEVKILGINETEFGQGSEKKKFYQITGIDKENHAVVFYRPAEENVKLGDIYNMCLSYDSKLKATIKYQKKE